MIRGLFDDNWFIIIIKILCVWFCVEFWNSIFVFVRVLFIFGELWVDIMFLLIDFFSLFGFLILFVNWILIVVDELNVMRL